MTHITHRKREEMPEMEPMFQMVEASMGFVPNSMFTMAYWPALLQAFGQLAGTVLGPGEIDPGLKQLIALVSSNASGCRYCQAHTSHSAEKRGVSTEKINGVGLRRWPVLHDGRNVRVRDMRRRIGHRL